MKTVKRHLSKQHTHKPLKIKKKKALFNLCKVLVVANAERNHVAVPDVTYPKGNAGCESQFQSHVCLTGIPWKTCLI